MREFVKRLINCSIVLAATFLFGLGFYTFSSTGIAEAEVLDLMDQLHQAEKNRDEKKLEEIFADEIFWSRHKDERFVTKKQAIENIKNAECRVKSTEATFVFTKVEYDKVKVSFEMQQKFICADENDSNHRGDYFYVFEKQQDKWKLTTIHLEN